MIATLLRRLRKAVWVFLYAGPAVAELVLHQVVEHTAPRRRLKVVGARVWMPPDVSFRFPENIELGADVRLGVGNRLWASPNARIVLGSM